MALAEFVEVPQTPQNAMNTELGEQSCPRFSSSVLQLCFQLPQQQLQVRKNALSPLKLKTKSFRKETHESQYSHAPDLSPQSLLILHRTVEVAPPQEP